MEHQQGLKSKLIIYFVLKNQLLILVLFCALCSSAQNLIVNGDFEYYNSCPTWNSQIYRASPWYDPNGATPDYFNSCAPTSSYVSIPNQLFGVWQYAHSGVGYAGFFARQNYGSNYREYIQVQLLDTLNNLQCYSVSFYTNLYNTLKIGTNNIGAYLSPIAVTSIAPNPIVATPQILLSGNPPIIDTINWVKISGIYQANGGEKYITIGNFNYDSTTTEQIIDASSPYNIAYYYIDDVSIFKIKTSNAGRDTTICHGDSVQLGTNNYEGVTYSWQPITGLSNANIGNPVASPNSTTTYYLTQTTPCAVTVDTVVVSVCDGIGVNELENKTHFKLYPNPNDGEFIVNFNKEIKDVKIEVRNVLGQIVYKDEIKNINQTAIKLNTIAGMYFLYITTGEEKQVIKLIKK